MKQSVYLSESEHARWKALGVSLGDVVRAGLFQIESERTLTAPVTFAAEAAPAGITGASGFIPLRKRNAADTGMQPKE